MRDDDLSGVGLGLRWESLDEVLGADEATLERVRFFEVSPENYMRRGGYFPRALGQIAEKHRLVSHGLSMSLGGVDPFDDDYFAELRAFLERHGGAWHSDHLCFSSHGGAALHDLLPVPFTAETERRVAARVREASDRLGRRMAVENISYYAVLGAPEHDEPDWLAALLDRADCGLLLDVNNLDVNAENHGFDPIAWLERIPLERVVEIHVAGPEPHASGVLLDTHGAPVRPSALELLRWVVERTGPVPVLLERDNQVPPLAELVAELATIDEVYQAALTTRRARLEARDVA
jgi:uncharacterized protein (UPF0276 family)